MFISPISSSNKDLNEDEIGAGRLLPDAFSLTTTVSAFYVFNRYKRFISRFFAFSGKYNPLIQSALQTDLYRGLPTHFSTGRGGSLP